jgi:hypothetical protein
MMEDRIGTIGSTQGVNESSRPKARNAAPMRHALPLRSVRWASEVSCAGRLIGSGGRLRGRLRVGQRKQGAGLRRIEAIPSFSGRVAQAGVRTALVGDAQCCDGGPFPWQLQCQLLRIGLHLLPKILVVFARPGRQQHRQGRAIAAQGDALAIEVVLRGDAPVQGELAVGAQFGAQRKGLLRLEEFLRQGGAAQRASQQRRCQPLNQ